jgi:hypothetical protein
LKEGQVVGQWRDSTYGIGGGRIPYDVNTALAPAALRGIAMLAANGFFPERPEWSVTAARYAQVWEDETLAFFRVDVPADEARQLVTAYAGNETLFNGSLPSSADTINSTITFHGLSLDGNDNQTIVKVMNTDDCFRHFLLNTTNDQQLAAFLDQTASNVLAPFPVGLSTGVGLVVANPAYGGSPVYASNWTTDAYHGTVVWSWQLAMMAAGLERQLGRCSPPPSSCSAVGETVKQPAFCKDEKLVGKVLAAYKHLWDVIDANEALLSSEVWSWSLDKNGTYVPELLVGENDVVQLWSLTFLAVTRRNITVGGA